MKQSLRGLRIVEEKDALKVAAVAGAAAAIVGWRRRKGKSLVMVFSVDGLEGGELEFGGELTWADF